MNRACRVRAGALACGLVLATASVVPAGPAAIAADAHTGALKVRITGVPDSATATVVVRGPDGWRRRIHETALLTGLEPGRYLIRPKPLQLMSGASTVAVTRNPVRLRPGGRSRTTIAFDVSRDGVRRVTAEPTDWEAEVIRLTNKARGSRQVCGHEGTFPAVPPLHTSAALTSAARRHARDMAGNDYFDHVDLRGRDAGERMSAAGYHWSAWGENIAAGQDSPAEVVRAWLDSDPHCANLMAATFTDIGVGQADGGGYGHYWVQNFARPA